MNDSLVHYDNERDMQAMVDDIVEFLMVETQRLIQTSFDKESQGHGNTYLLVSQNLTISLVTSLLLEMRLRQESFIRNIAGKSPATTGAGGNRLPINGPDFFIGHRRVKP